MRKILFIVLDGAAGSPCRTLGGKTEFEAAITPCIDSLFNHSVNGLMHVVGPNIAPESDVAAFSILGYTPFNVPARGVTEAIGSGMEYKEGEVALRCNIASVSRGRIVKLRLSNLTDEQGKEVERLINEGISLDVPFTFKHTSDYRGVLVLHEKLSSKVSNTHPGYIRERVGSELITVARNVTEGLQIKECRPLSPEARRTAELINDFTSQAAEVLGKAFVKDNLGTEANYILVRDAGNSLPKLDSFKKVYGVNFSLVAEMPVELGIAKLLGFSIIPDIHDLSLLAVKVVNELRKKDGVYVHIKGPDKYGHLGDAAGKTGEIERIDKEFMKSLLGLIDLGKVTVCVTSDHATPSCFGSHSADPVPYLITDGESSAGHFCEKNVRQEFIHGVDLMKKVISTAKS